MGCPIAGEKRSEVSLYPQRSSYDADAAGEAVLPVRDVAQKSQEQMCQQAGPDLPLDGLFVRANKVAQLEGLLEFFEERFDRPACAVEFRDGARTPLGVVGNEGHLALHAIDHHERRDPAQEAGIGLGSGDSSGANQFVLQNLSLTGKSLDGGEEHIRLGSQDKEYAAIIQIGKERKVNIGTIRQQYVAGHHASAEYRRTNRVVVSGVLYHREGWQKGSDVQSQMTLGGGLTPTMARPVDAGERELKRGRVQSKDLPLESEDEPRVLPVFGKARAHRLQMGEHLPVQLLGDRWVAGAVGVREGVAGGWRRTAYP